MSSENGAEEEGKEQEIEPVDNLQNNELAEALAQIQPDNLRRAKPWMPCIA